MKQIEIEMNDAIRAGRTWRKSNTVVMCDPLSWSNMNGCKDGEKARIYLFGNCICVVYTDGRRAYSTTGWDTTTTRSRLQALGAGCRIFRGRMIDDAGRPFYDGRL